ncbi:MAG TPA: fibronectin type III domain-containing protein [Acidimicrobiia bacterium]
MIVASKAARRSLARHVERLVTRVRGRSVDHDRDRSLGFTLVELVVAVTVLGMIMVPLATATVFFLDHGLQANALFQDDNGVRLANTYFTRDVESAASLDVSSAGCNAGTGDTLVMSLLWTTNGISEQASWFTETSSGTTSLVRHRCTAGSMDENNTLATLASAGSVWLSVTGGNSAPTAVHLGFTNANGLMTTLSATPRWATSSSTAVPMPPAGVSATAASGSAIVQWLAPVYDGGSAVTAYKVTASPGGATCSTAPPTTTCTLTGLTNGSTYTLSVTATNANGTSAPATTSVVVATVPGAPTTLSATGGDQQALVSWSAPVSNGGSAITSYTATASPGGQTCTTSAPTTSCTITGLTNGSTYTVSVTATNAIGTGPAATTSVSAGRAPDAPTGLTARAENAKALLAWTAPVNNGGYVISSYTATATPGNATCVSAFPTTTCTITGLTNGTLYTVSVTATNAKGTSAPSSSVTVTPQPVPGPPTNVVAGSAGAVSTLAGSGTAGYVNATGSSAQFSAPQGVAVDTSGNVYVADTSNQRIRKITSGGVATLLAGSGTAGYTDATGSSAAFNNPAGVTADASGNVYVADKTNNRIRKITAAGVVTTLAGSGTAGFADGTGTAASFNAPLDVAVDASGNVYVADTANNRIRKITAAGVVTTLAGSGTAGFADGTGTAAKFNAPSGIDVDSSGNLWVADTANNRVRKITSAGVVTTLAGSGTAGSTDGQGTAATFNAPYGIAVDSLGNVYVSSQTANTIREVTSGGLVSTLAGSGSSGSSDANGNSATFNAPAGMETDSGGHLYVADKSSNKIRAVTWASGGAMVSWLAPSSQGGSSITSYTITASPGGTTCTSSTLMCTFTGLTGGTSYTFISTATNSYGLGEDSSPSNVFIPLALPGAPTGVSAIGGNTNAQVSWTAPASNGGATITSYTATASTGQSCSTAATSCTISGLTNNTSITVTVYATNAVGNGPSSSAATVMPGFVPNAPTSVTAGASGTIGTLAGSSSGYQDGTGTGAKFNTPTGFDFDNAGNMYLADALNYRIRKITPAGVATTFAGSGSAGSSDGTGTAASFTIPEGIGVDSSGNVFVADTYNNEIRKITPAGVVTTFAGSTTAGSANGTGTAASFNGPSDIAIDASNNLYVADSNNNEIRKITTAGVVTTFAGSTTAGSANGTGTSAQFSLPEGLNIDSSGNLYVADTNNRRIRKITPAAVVTTIAGSGTSGYLDGPTGTAQFNTPTSVEVDASGNLYVADYGDNHIREITGGYVSTLAGSGSASYADGTGVAAIFNTPARIRHNPSGNLFIADTANNRIRTLSFGGSSSTVTWTAPTANGGQSPTSYTVTSSPGGITCISTATACTMSGLTNGTAYTFTVTATNGTGTGSASSASNSFTPYAAPGAPTGVSATPGNTTAAVTWTAPASNGGTAITGYLATASSGQSCATTSTSCSITGLTNNVSITITVTATNIIGTGPTSSAASVMPGFVPNAPTNVVAGRVGVVGTLAGSSAGDVDGTGTNAEFNNPNNIALDSSGNLYVADQVNNVIRKVTPAGVVTTFAGNGTAGYVNGSGTSAEFNQPQGVAVDSSGNVYVADTNNNDIRKITSSGTTSLFAGSSSQASGSTDGSRATFNQPNGIALDSSGNLYVADTNNNKIRKITSGGTTSTFAGSGTAGFADGTGTAAKFSGPQGLTVDSSGNVYVADTANNRVRKITSVGVVTTIAGSGTAGWVDGLSTSAQLNQPKGVTIDPGGSVYVADQGNNAIRMISTSNYVSTVAGTGSNTYADGTGTAAALGSPIDIAINSSGLMYVSDSNDEHIRTLSVASGDSLVTWTAPSANGGQSPTSYTVTSSPGGLTCTSSTTNCAIAGLTNGTAYTFTVTATNGTGTGSASSASNSFTPVTTPGAPTSASAVTAGTGKASVSWTAPASTGGSSIIRYNVTSNVGSHTCTTTSTTCTVSGLTSGSTYTFTVTATNGVGTGPASTATHSIVST